MQVDDRNHSASLFDGARGGAQLDGLIGFAIARWSKSWAHAGSRQKVIYRHSGAMRVTNVVVLLVLLMSGLQIFNAHQGLYFGAKSNFDDGDAGKLPRRVP